MNKLQIVLVGSFLLSLSFAPLACLAEENRPRTRSFAELPKIIEFFLDELKSRTDSRVSAHAESFNGEYEEENHGLTLSQKLQARINRKKKLFYDFGMSDGGDGSNLNVDGGMIDSNLNAGNSVNSNGQENVAERIKNLKKYIKSKSDKLSVSTSIPAKKPVKNEYRHIFIGKK
jgi:hypothetical protein